MKKTLDPLAVGESPGSDQPTAFQTYRTFSDRGGFNANGLHQAQADMEKEQQTSDQSYVEDLNLLPRFPRNNLATGGRAKAPKATAHYRLGSNTTRCLLCTMFRSPDSCTAVTGKISPKGLCNYFKRKVIHKAEGGEVDPLTGLPDDNSYSDVPGVGFVSQSSPDMGPSWAHQAKEQTEKDIEAYQKNGVPGLMADTSGTQELAGGFGGNATPGVGGAFAGVVRRVPRRVAAPTEAAGIPRQLTLEEELAKVIQGEHPTPESQPSGPLNVNTFFEHASPSEVEHLTRSDMQILDQQLRRTENPYIYREKNRELFEALEARFDKEMPKAGDPEAKDPEFEQAYNQPQHNFSNLDELEQAYQAQHQPLADFVHKPEELGIAEHSAYDPAEYGHEAPTPPPARSRPTLVGQPPRGPFASVSEGFHDYFNRVLSPHVKNLDELGQKMFAGTDVSRVHVGTASVNGLVFNGELRGPGGEDVGSITRYIFPNQKYAKHDLFSATDWAREQGIPSKILKGQIDLYRQMGLNKVKTFASLSSGPYAWLKYGYIPDVADWNSIRGRITRDISSDSIHIDNPETKERIFRILENPNPRSAWDLSDIKAQDKYGNDVGQLALLGNQYRRKTGPNKYEPPLGPTNYWGSLQRRSWSGEMLLNDAAVMARFNRYVSRKPKDK